MGSINKIAPPKSITITGDYPDVVEKYINVFK